MDTLLQHMQQQVQTMIQAQVGQQAQAHEWVNVRSDRATGTTEWRGCWYAKISVNGKREKVKLVTADGRPLNREEEDRALAKEMAAELSKAVRAKAGRDRSCR